MRDEQLLQRATEIFESKYTKSNTRWNKHVVADYIEESVLTTMALPPAQVPGLRKSLWSYVRHTPNEITMQELVPTRSRPTPDAIARQEQTLKWMSWITAQERDLVWMRGARMGWKKIGSKINCHDVTAWRKWQHALEKISRQLNKLGTSPDRRIYERPRSI